MCRRDGRCLYNNTTQGYILAPSSMFSGPLMGSPPAGPERRSGQMRADPEIIAAAIQDMLDK